MANVYADLIIALTNVYPNTVTALDTFRKGIYTAQALDAGKACVRDYKIYGNKRRELEIGSSKTKDLLGIILNDLGEGPIFVERNIVLIRKYISAYDPLYVEPESV